MFERFTRGAREAVVGAQAEARELDQAPIGTQHLLLALLADTDGPIARALRGSGVDAAYVREQARRRMGPQGAAIAEADTEAEDKAALMAIGIDLDAVRAAIEENFGAGSLRLPRETTKKRRRLFGRLSAATGHIPFSPRAKKVLELSLREALRLKQKVIAPEHIMLGLLREGRGLATLILREKDVDFEALRAELNAALADRAA